MENKKEIRSSTAEYLTFVAATGEQSNSTQMRYEDENIWLTQKMMAELYDVSVPAINQHIKKIFDDEELDEKAVIKKYLITASDGKTYNTNHYNLQMIISVGFKVNNERAIMFRKWANAIVKDYTIQGWAMDTESLKKSGTILDKDYFEKQLEKIREIRLSERRFCQKITDIYATAIDYDSSARLQEDFLLLYRIRCTLVFMEKQPLNSFMIEQMQLRHIWDLLVGMVRLKEKFISWMW